MVHACEHLEVSILFSVDVVLRRLHLGESFHGDPFEQMHSSRARGIHHAALFCCLLLFVVLKLNTQDDDEK